MGESNMGGATLFSAVSGGCSTDADKSERFFVRGEGAAQRRTADRELHFAQKPPIFEAVRFCLVPLPVRRTDSEIVF